MRSSLLACVFTLVQLASPTVVKADPGGGTWNAGQAEPSEVVVGDLPAVSSDALRTPGKLSRQALRVKNPTAYAAAKKSPKGPHGIAIPQKSAAPSAPAVVLSAGPFASSFPGVSLHDAVSAFGQNANVEPPDTQMAAGPTALLEVINVVGQVFYKSGAPAGAMFLLSSWFGLPSTYEPGDPHVLYDAIADRWYASLMAFNPTTGGSKVILAVSTSSNPAGAWRRYTVYTSAHFLCDQPKLGYSSDKFVIGCTDFDLQQPPNSQFQGAVMIVASKTEALAGKTVAYGWHGPDTSLFGLVPAQNTTAGKDAYVVLNLFDTQNPRYELFTITGDPAAGLSHVILFYDVHFLMAATSVPPLASQSGSTSKIDTGDDRFISAVVRGPKLWTTATSGCMPDTDTAVRACIWVFEFNIPDLNVDNETIAGMVGKYLFYPTLNFDANGNGAIDYSLSSDTDFPSHGAMYLTPAQVVPADLGILQAGTGAYTPNSDTIHRWGDYAASAADPSEPTRVWVAGEYSTGADGWATGIGAIDFTTLHVDPTGIGFGKLALGGTSGPQALTVTNSGSVDVPVTAALNSGDTSQFDVVDNACSSITLHPTDTCTAHFTFSPTTAGDKQARFNVSAPNFAPLSLVLSGTGVGPTCASAAITTDVPSPQNVGTPVALNATSAGCPHANPLYRFYLRSPAGVWSIVRAFSTSATFAWNTTGFTPGTYLTGVWVKDASSTKTYDAYAFGTFTLQLPYCAFTSLSSLEASPQSAGPTVHFTATTSTSCPDPLHQWWVRNAAGVWAVAVPYAVGTTFAWDTAALPDGTYQVGVWAKQTGSPKSYDAFAFVTFTLGVISATTHCQAVNVAATPDSPQSQGTPVTLTAAPHGCDTAQYKWWVRDTKAVWAIVQNYSTSDTYDFTTTSRPPGTYLVGVWVRQTGSTASYEAYSFITYTLTIAPDNAPCTSVGISPDVASPQAPGTSITFTADALGCTTHDYQFFLAPPPSGVFGVVQPFGPSNTFVWNTTSLAPGPYQVGVWARHIGSNASYEAFAFITFQLEVVFTSCTTLTVSTSPRQVVLPGTSPVTFTATASGCPSPRYKFYLRSGSGAFVIVQAYGASNTFTWAASPSAGSWTMEVLAEDAASPDPYDSLALTDYRVV